ncbi:jg1377, partial [Pararge aegeria aegeria]
MRITQYHQEGVQFTEDFLERIMHRATELGLPPHKKLGLLTLSQKVSVQEGDDMLKIAQSTVDLFKTEWSDNQYAQTLTDEKLLTVEGRREVFYSFVNLCNTWQRRKAFVDVLACWPPTV